MIRLWYAALAALVLSLLAVPGAGAAPKRLGVVSAGVLNVRAKPARHFERIGKFHRGDTVKVIQETDEWLEVVVPEDAKAWVARKHLDADGVVTATKLQIRSGPGIVFTAYATADKGAKLKLVGPPLDEWQQILAPDTATGWVNRAYVRLQDPIPVATKPAEKPAKPTPTVVAKVPEPKPAAPEQPVAARKPEPKPAVPEQPVAVKKPEPPKPTPPEAKQPEPEPAVARKAAPPAEPTTGKADQDATEFIRQIVRKETGVEVIIEAREPKLAKPGKPAAVKMPEPEPVVAKKPEPKSAAVEKPEPKPEPAKTVAVEKPAPQPTMAKKPEPKPAPRKTVVIEKPAPQPTVAKKPDPKPEPAKTVAIEKPAPQPTVIKKPEPKPVPKKTVVIEKPAPQPAVAKKPETEKPEPVIAKAPTAARKPEPPKPAGPKLPDMPKPEQPAQPEAVADSGGDVAYLAPIRAPDAPSVPRPTVRRPRYEAPLFVAKANSPQAGADVEPTAPKAEPKETPVEATTPQPDVPDKRVVAIVPTGEAAVDSTPVETVAADPPKTERAWEEGVLFSLKDQAVPEASHILYRREGTVCYPICYLRSSRIPLSQWELREVRLYGDKVEIPGWSRPVIEVKGVQIKTLD